MAVGTVFYIFCRILPVGVVSAALVEFAPVVNGLGELAVIFPVESRGGDVVLFIPLCVGLD